MVVGTLTTNMFIILTNENHWCYHHFNHRQSSSDKPPTTIRHHFDHYQSQLDTTSITTKHYFSNCFTLTTTIMTATTIIILTTRHHHSIPFRSSIIPTLTTTLITLITTMPNRPLLRPCRPLYIARNTYDYKFLISLTIFNHL